MNVYFLCIECWRVLPSSSEVTKHVFCLFVLILECTVNELLTVRVDFSKKLSVNRIVCVYIYIYIEVLVNMKLTPFTFLSLVVKDSSDYVIPKKFGIQFFM